MFFFLLWGEQIRGLVSTSFFSQNEGALLCFCWGGGGGAQPLSQFDFTVSLSRQTFMLTEFISFGVSQMLLRRFSSVLNVTSHDQTFHFMCPLSISVIHRMLRSRWRGFNCLAPEEFEQE